MFTPPIGRLIVASAIAVAASGCNSRLPVIDEKVPTAPSNIVVGDPPPPLPPAPPFPVSMVLSPAAVFSGSTATGRVMLSYPAPDSGFRVALSSGDAAVTVPTSVNVAPGAQVASFPITTSPLSREITVSIGATSGDRAVQATLDLWFRAPPFIATWRDPGNGQPITASRVTKSGLQWRANCYGSGVFISAFEGPTFYYLRFAAPSGTPIKPGTYENAQSSGPPLPTLPTLQIDSPNFFNCSAPQPSRFTVTEADVVSDLYGTVRRFTATFEQRCGSVTIRGETSVVGIAPADCCGDRCILPR